MFVIAGATGNTGAVVAQTLLAQGHPVRALVHDAAKGAGLRERGAEVLAVDLGDAEAVRRALTGARGAYLLLPPKPTSSQVLEDNARVVEGLARAIEGAGRPHVVLLSSIGAHLPGGTGPIRALHAAEARLRETGAPVTAVRAAYFMENWGASLGGVPGGVLPSFIRADVRAPMVATRDIGRVAAGALVEGGRGFEVIELAGPKDYTPVEVAAALTELTGKPITLEVGPLDAVAPTFEGFGVSSDLAGLYREMLSAMNDGRLVFEGPPARGQRGAVPIEDVLRGLLGR